MTTATAGLRCSAALRRFLIEIPRNHEGTVVRVEIQDAGSTSTVHTVLTLASPDRHERRWRLPRPPYKVTDDDLAPIRRSLVCRSWLSAWLGRAFHFGGWWLGFTGFFAMGSICPCCGQAGCVMGIGAAGTLGAVATLVLSKLKSLGRRPRSTRSEPFAKEHAGETNRRVWGAVGAALAAVVLAVLTLSWAPAALFGGKAKESRISQAPDQTAGSPSEDTESDRRGRPAKPSASTALALDFRAFRDVRIDEDRGPEAVRLPAAVKDAIGKRVQIQGIGFYYMAGMYRERVCGFLLLPPFAVASGEESVPEDLPQWSVQVECSTASWVRLSDYPRPVRAKVEGYLAFNEPNPNGYLFTIRATRVEIQPLESSGLSPAEGGPPCPRCGLRHTTDPAANTPCCDGCRRP